MDFVHWKSGGGDGYGEKESSRSLAFKNLVNGKLFSSGYILRPERILWILWSGFMNNMDH